MWPKLAVGAVGGLIVGHFAEPGYVLWLVLGVAAGYIAEVWGRRSGTVGESEDV